MHFYTRDGLLYRSALRFSELFETRSISYYIIGGYALINHGVVRNTTDIDVVVNEDDFLEAVQVKNLFPALDNEPTCFLVNVQIFRDIGYSSVLADGLCARFRHEDFLPIDLLSSPVFAPHPSPANRVHFERSIYFCTLPSKCTKALWNINTVLFLFPVLIQTKVKAMIGRPLKEETLVKRMQGSRQHSWKRLFEAIPFSLFIPDHVDLCTLIVHHGIKKEYAKMNNFEPVVQAAFERVHCDYYGKLLASTGKTKVARCVCQ